MVVRTSSTLSTSAPNRIEIKALAKRSVWMITDHMDPIPRVRDIAIFSSFSMGFCEGEILILPTISYKW